MVFIPFKWLCHPVPGSCFSGGTARLYAVTGVFRGCFGFKGGLIVLWRQDWGWGLTMLSSSGCCPEHLHHWRGVGACSVAISPKTFPPIPPSSPAFSLAVALKSSRLASEQRNPCSRACRYQLFQATVRWPIRWGFLRLSPPAAGTKEGLGPRLILPRNLRPDTVFSFKNSCWKDFEDVVTATLTGKWSSSAASGCEDLIELWGKAGSWTQSFSDREQGLLQRNSPDACLPRVLAVPTRDQLWPSPGQSLCCLPSWSCFPRANKLFYSLFSMWKRHSEQPNCPFLIAITL